MRRVATAVSAFQKMVAVAFVATAIACAVALAACAKDAADPGAGSDDAGSSTPDVTYYDTSIPPFDADLPPDDDQFVPPPDEAGPPPPACSPPTGQPCFVDQSACPFLFDCLAAAVPVLDAGAAEAGDAGDAGDASDAGDAAAADAGPQPDGVCVVVFDNITDCNAGACAGSRCLLAANKCLQASEIACVCGSADAGAASPCGP
jgi:hypothetical protein